MRPSWILPIKLSVIAFIFYFLSSPVLFLQDPELFEYNKMMVVYSLTVIIAGAWLIRGGFRFGPFGIPLLIYLGAHILSTIFSIDPHVSLWGYYSRFHEGLFATLSYVILYFAAVSCLDKGDIKNILKSSFVSSFGY